MQKVIRIAGHWQILGVMLAYTFFLNAGALAMFFRGKMTGLAALSVDDSFYFSMINRVAEGNLLIGNTALIEHQHDGAASTYGALLQGLLLKILPVSIDGIALLGGLVLPLLLMICFARLLRFLTADPAIIALGTLILTAILEAGLLRPINPQLTLIIITAYLILFMEKGLSRKRGILKGALIGCTVYLQIVLAAFLLVIEGTEALLKMIQTRRVVPILKEKVAVFVPFALLLLIKLWLDTGRDPLAYADTLHRLGLIASRYPANPKLQIIVIGILVLLIVFRSRFTSIQTWTKFFTLLLASVIALNQSVLHGVDVIFGLYYATIIQIILWFTCIALIITLIPKRITYIILGIASVVLVIRTAPGLLERRYLLLRGDMPQYEEILQHLDAQTGSLVIAAPHRLADMIPVYTSHFVLFNRTARYQNATDQELAERYLLEESLFPTPEEEIDTTYNLVFGLYAGNVSARTRTACTAWKKITRNNIDCTQSIRDHIIHQDILKLLDEKNPDINALLKKYQLDLIVTDRAMNPAFSDYCAPAERVRQWRVYRCS